MAFRKRFLGGGNSGKKYARREPAVMHDAVCTECGNACQVPFKPTGGKPVLCKSCFRKDDSAGESRGGRDFGDRKLFKTTCASCGDECQVPFRPSGEKPIYCHECFGKNMPSREDKPSVSKSSGSDGMTQAQFKILNTKLDKILDVLESGA